MFRPRLPDSTGYTSGLDSAVRRFAVVMAIFPVIVALRLVSNDLTFWNFPCNSPCPHTTFFVQPMLDYQIYSLIGYAIFSFLYFSVDYFRKYSHGESFRELCGRVATVLLYLYPAFVAYVALTTEGSYLLPGWVQGWYWVFAYGVLGLLAISAAQTLVGKSLFRPYFAHTHGFLELVTFGMQIQGGFVHYGIANLIARIRGQPILVPELPIKGTFRLERLSLIVVVAAASAGVAWRVANLRGWNVLAVVEIALGGLMIFSAILGWSRRKSESNRKNSELRVPRYLWSRFRARCWMRLLALLGRTQVRSAQTN